MKNFVQKGDVLNLLIAGGCSSGDPVMVGSIGGVATSDVAEGAKGQIKTSGVFDLAAKAIDGAGNSAVSVGDKLYFVDEDTPKLSKKTTGGLFGFALEAIDAGATDTINVLLCRVAEA